MIVLRWVTGIGVLLVIFFGPLALALVWAALLDRVIPNPSAGRDWPLVILALVWLAASVGGMAALLDRLEKQRR